MTGPAFRAALLFSWGIAFASSGAGCSARGAGENKGTGGVGGTGSGGVGAVEGTAGRGAGGKGGTGFGSAGVDGTGAAGSPGSGGGASGGGGGPTGGSSGSGVGGDSRGGSNGAGGSPSGMSYCGAFYSGGLDHATIQERDTVRSLCFTLLLSSPTAVPSAGLTLPPTWGLAFGFVGALLATGCGPQTTRADTLGGIVSWVPASTYPPLTADVDVVMTFPPGDAGLPATEHLHAQGVDMRAGCPP